MFPWLPAAGLPAHVFVGVRSALVASWTPLIPIPVTAVLSPNNCRHLNGVHTVFGQITQGIDIMNQWFNRPDYKATMENCGNEDIGVWSVNALDRSVLVAVYGHGDAAPPVAAGGRQFGSPSSPP